MLLLTSIFDTIAGLLLDLHNRGEFAPVHPEVSYHCGNRFAAPTLSWQFIRYVSTPHIPALAQKLILLIMLVAFET